MPLADGLTLIRSLHPLDTLVLPAAAHACASTKGLTTLPGLRASLREKTAGATLG